ncbi:hypothetical protein RHSIM_Rhsim03G0026700 [Rhododendron simsii]|uniref:Uncharacterized protein n=1 Tax=Rhododendron simsii TaxID=118357 RepID=A0A834H7E0_RHOSS|nr:hypothetical protein RHSIM_Rhsim03G0026700 [Rhododendron simsii]
MLSRHGDPYALIISRKEYKIGSNGNLQGVGLFINMEPKTRHLVSEPHDHCLLVNLPQEIIKHSPIFSTISHHGTQEGHLLKTRYVKILVPSLLDGLKLAHELKMPSYYFKETILVQEKTLKRDLHVASDAALVEAWATAKFENVDPSLEATMVYIELKMRFTPRRTLWD